MFFFNQIKISDLQEGKYYYLLSENSKSQVKVEGLVRLDKIVNYQKEDDNYDERFELELSYQDGISLRNFVISNEDEYHIGEGYSMNYFFFENIENINQVIQYYLDRQLSSTKEYNRWLKPEYRISKEDGDYAVCEIFSEEYKTKSIFLIRGKEYEDIIIDYHRSSNHLFIKEKYIPKDIEQRKLYIQQLINYINNSDNINVAVIFTDCEIIHEILIKQDDVEGTIYEGFDSPVNEIYKKQWLLQF